MNTVQGGPPPHHSPKYKDTDSCRGLFKNNAIKNNALSPPAACPRFEISDASKQVLRR